MVASFVSTLISAVLLAMLIRSLISLFFFESENRFIDFIYFVTEPFIIPVRAFMERFNILQDTPLDFSFMITVILLATVNVFI